MNWYCGDCLVLLGSSPFGHGQHWVDEHDGRPMFIRIGKPDGSRPDPLLTEPQR